MRKLTTYNLPLTTKNRGVVLILTFIMMITLTAITGAFLYMTSIQTKGSGYDTASNKALWLAEAGIQKAIWYLKTPVGSGGKGDDWLEPAPGLTENLGSGSYTMVVTRYFALEVTATASTTQGGNKASKAIDGTDGGTFTYWESKDPPTVPAPQWIKIAFPDTLMINKVRFLSTVAANIPKDYTWQVSTDGSSWTTVVTVVGNNLTDRTDEFSSQPDVNYLRLHITASGTAGQRVRVYTLETIGIKITSTGSVSGVERKVEQTVVANGTPDPVTGTGTAGHQKDWNEIVPAT